MSFTIHYRQLPKKYIASFRHTANAAITPFLKTKQIRLLDDQFSFDISPNVRYTKGECARDLFRKLRPSPRAVPIYIGDALTDEDAFRAFPTGITIRVGKTTSTTARYYFPEQKNVISFLSKIM